ncbi:MAG: hypothetical protein J6S58_06155 [Lentisphaeria bacterium]|nr:hypothetical protein [Lentisphaeria bacterium]
MLGFLWDKSSEFTNYARAFRLGQMKDDDAQLDAVVLGSTQILHAVDFSLQNEIRGENLAFSVQPFLYDVLILKRFAGNIRKGGTVFFGISLFNFVLYDFSARLRNSYRFKRYSLLCGPELFSGCSRKEYRRLKRTFLLRSYLYRLIRMKGRGKIDFLPAGKKSPTHETLAQDARKRIEDIHKNYFAPPAFRDLQDDTVVEKNVELLCSGIEFARSQGLNPVLLLVPNAPEYCAASDAGQMEKYLWKPLEKVVRKSQVPVMDYVKDPRFAGCENHENALILSADGRKKFTEELVKRIKSATVNVSSR